MRHVPGSLRQARHRSGSRTRARLLGDADDTGSRTQTLAKEEWVQQMGVDEAKMEELKHRVEARRKSLEAELEEKKADASAGTSEAADSIRDRLRALDETISSGWDNLSDAAVERLNDWLRRDDEASQS